MRRKLRFAGTNAARLAAVACLAGGCGPARPHADGHPTVMVDSLGARVDSGHGKAANKRGCVNLKTSEDALGALVLKLDDECGPRQLGQPDPCHTNGFLNEFFDKNSVLYHPIGIRRISEGDDLIRRRELTRNQREAVKDVMAIVDRIEKDGVWFRVKGSALCRIGDYLPGSPSWVGANQWVENWEGREFIPYGKMVNEFSFEKKFNTHIPYPETYYLGHGECMAIEFIAAKLGWYRLTIENNGRNNVLMYFRKEMPFCEYQ